MWTLGIKLIKKAHIPVKSDLQLHSEHCEEKKLEAVLMSSMRVSFR